MYRCSGRWARARCIGLALTRGPDASETRPRRVSVTTPSLRNNFTARFLADTYGLVTSIVAASLTARVLGPSGRGYYASLVLLTVLFAQLFGAGLGEAAIVLPGRGRATYGAARSATIAVLLPLGVIGALACIATGAVTLDALTVNERTALALAGLLVLLNVCSGTLAWFLISLEKLVLVSIVTTISATVIVVSLCLFLIVLDMQTAGAILASVVGIVVILGALVWYLPREGISLRPAWDSRYLWAAARFGMAIQLSNVLVQMAGRLDLLFVYRIAGSSSAGLYSIALTLGALVGSVPIAIAHASFPRLPKLTEDEARALTASLFRAGVAAAVTCCTGLAILAPVAIPLMFGPDYRDAVLPTLVLLPAGVLWSAQWILCRAAAARASSRPLLTSYAASSIVMVLLDMVLIGPFGIMGAALASFISSTTGLVVAVIYLLRSGWDWRSFVPRVRDWVVMVGTLRRIVAALRRHGQSSSESPVPVLPPQA